VLSGVPAAYFRGRNIGTPFDRVNREAITRNHCVQDAFDARPKVGGMVADSVDTFHHPGDLGCQRVCSRSNHVQRCLVCLEYFGVSFGELGVAGDDRFERE
jgi:hypothetical protein